MARDRHKSLTCSPGCAVEATLTLIDGKWKGLVLFHLLGGTLRFNELRKAIPNVTQRMLTNQLRELEDDGLIIRTVYPQVPPRVDYRLTQVGRSLEPVITALKSWARDHIDLSSGRVRAGLFPEMTEPAASPHARSS